MGWGLISNISSINATLSIGPLYIENDTRFFTWEDIKIHANDTRTENK